MSFSSSSVLNLCYTSQSLSEENENKHQELDQSFRMDDLKLPNKIIQFPHCLICHVCLGIVMQIQNLWDSIPHVLFCVALLGYFNVSHDISCETCEYNIHSSFAITKFSKWNTCSILKNSSHELLGKCFWNFFSRRDGECCHCIAAVSESIFNISKFKYEIQVSSAIAVRSNNSSAPFW